MPDILSYFKKNNQIYFLLFTALLLFNCSNHGRVVTYPPPPGLATSEDLSITVNGQSIWVEKLQSNMELDSLPDWFTRTSYTNTQQQVNIANFSCSGPIIVTISCKEPVDTFTIRPKSRGITATKNGNELTFQLPGPDNLYIEINRYPALCLFANPLEKAPPAPNNKNVIYYGPGEHHAGLITLQDNDILYIAGGAIVYGAINGEPQNAKVLGRGILDGGYKHRLVYLKNASNVEFNGVILRNGKSWQNTLVNCDDMIYENVKVISFGNSGDGINPVGSRNFTINNCFLRCTDDCVAIKSPDENTLIDSIRVTNNTMIGYAFSDGLTIGFETNGPSIKNVLVSNCDILIARGGSLVDGHSAFSIICDGPAWITNILFENIRVEENVEKLFELNITDGTKYQIDPPGHIKGIHLKDIAWEIKKPIVLSGFDDSHIVQDVTFENCTVAGQLIKSPQEEIFKINQYVKDVQVK